MAKQTVKRNTRPTVPTMNLAFQEFIQEKRARNLAPTSIKDYEESYKYFVRFFQFDEKTLISSISETLMQTYCISLLESDLKTASINRYLRDLRVFFNWSYNNNYVDSPIRINMVKGQEEPIKAFPEEDLLLILQRPTNLDDFVEWRNWMISNWILATGNRASTVCDLHIGDVDFKNREITLRHTKNKKSQVIPLSSTLETLLKEYIITWRFESSPEDYIFPNVGNEKLSRGALTHSFIKYCKKRGSSHTNIHGLRHSFALGYIRNGGNQFKLQKILGHSTLEMTKRYVSLVSQDLKEDFDKFSTLDNIRKSKKPKKTVIKWA